MGVHCQDAFRNNRISNHSGRRVFGRGLSSHPVYTDKIRAVAGPDGDARDVFPAPFQPVLTAAVKSLLYRGVAGVDDVDSTTDVVCGGGGAGCGSGGAA
jgi:hypothetical protein